MVQHLVRDLLIAKPDGACSRVSRIVFLLCVETAGRFRAFLAHLFNPCPRHASCPLATDPMQWMLDYLKNKQSQG